MHVDVNIDVEFRGPLPMAFLITQHRWMQVWQGKKRYTCGVEWASIEEFFLKESTKC